MISFHGEKAIKVKYISRIKAHAKADEIIKGTYWQDGKGCAVGCTIHSGDHAAYEKELGIPRVLARLEDGIFEGLPNSNAMKWPLQFLSSVKVGSDLSLVWPKFAIWLLTDEKFGVMKYAKTKQEKISIENVANLYKRMIKGEDVSIQEWDDAAANAAANAAYAAYAAADAADAAANAAYAAYAAADAAYYAANAAARSEHRIAQATKLLELIRKA